MRRTIWSGLVSLLWGVTAAGVTAGISAPELTAAQEQVVQVADGSRAGCLVWRPHSTLPGVRPNRDYLTVEIRVPDAPSAEALAQLPAAERQVAVAMWPIIIRLENAPTLADHRPAVLQPRRIVPGAGGPSLILRALERGAAMFLRVSYPRAALQAGVEIVAERKVGKRPTEASTTETRCRITPTEVALWP